MFNVPRGQLTYSFGYPGNIADAEIMSVCISKPIISKCGLPPRYRGQGLRCGMTQGCSGGPWILNFVGTTGRGYINSVNSYTCQLLPYIMHGP
ncbi:unnamed protein product, partial [Rotaria sp. Silwood2]